jgi:hypothetical protein
LVKGVPSVFRVGAFHLKVADPGTPGVPGIAGVTQDNPYVASFNKFVMVSEPDRGFVPVQDPAAVQTVAAVLPVTFQSSFTDSGALPVRGVAVNVPPSAAHPGNEIKSKANPRIIFI